LTTIGGPTTPHAPRTDPPGSRLTQGARFDYMLPLT
jgi:hypothetical protein